MVTIVQILAVLAALVAVIAGIIHRAVVWNRAVAAGNFLIGLFGGAATRSWNISARIGRWVVGLSILIGIPGLVVFIHGMREESRSETLLGGGLVWVGLTATVVFSAAIIDFYILFLEVMQRALSIPGMLLVFIGRILGFVVPDDAGQLRIIDAKAAERRVREVAAAVLLWWSIYALVCGLIPDSDVALSFPLVGSGITIALIVAFTRGIETRWGWEFVFKGGLAFAVLAGGVIMILGVTDGWDSFKGASSPVKMCLGGLVECHTRPFARPMTKRLADERGEAFRYSDADCEAEIGALNGALKSKKISMPGFRRRLSKLERVCESRYRAYASVSTVTTESLGMNDRFRMLFVAIAIDLYLFLLLWGAYRVIKMRIKYRETYGGTAASEPASTDAGENGASLTWLFLLVGGLLAAGLASIFSIGAEMGDLRTNLLPSATGMVAWLLLILVVLAFLARWSRGLAGFLAASAIVAFAIISWWRWDDWEKPSAAVLAERNADQLEEEWHTARQSTAPATTARQAPSPVREPARTAARPQVHDAEGLRELDALDRRDRERLKRFPRLRPEGS